MWNLVEKMETHVSYSLLQCQSSLSLYVFYKHLEIENVKSVVSKKGGITRAELAIFNENVW